MNFLCKTFVLFFLLSKFLFSEELQFTQIEKNYLEKNSPLIVQAHNSFPPFNYSENEKLMGYTHDYIKLMHKHSGIKFKFTAPKPWAESLVMFKNNEIDILPHITKNKTRMKYIDYTNFNHLEYQIGITVRKDNSIDSMNDLKDKIIAVVNKSFVHNVLKLNYLNQKLLLTPSTSDAISLVSSGKADAFIGSIPVMDFYIKKSWYNNVTTKIIDDIGLHNKIQMPMGVHKGNTILKSILEKVHNTLPYKEMTILKEKWLNLEHHSKKHLLFSKKEKVYLNTKENIKMCVMPNLLPFGKIDQNGNHIGIGSDIINIISKKINKKIILVPTKMWKKSIEYLENKQCDIIPLIVNTASRRDTMKFTTSFISDPFILVTKLDKMFIKDSTELEHKKIGIVKNYAFLELLKERNPNIIIVPIKNIKSGLEKVRNGELYGYADSISPAMYAMNENAMNDLKIAGKLEFNIKLSIASRIDEPILNHILQKAIDTISDKDIKKIKGKWRFIKIEQETNYTLLLQISVAFILIILIILYRNYKIKKYTAEIESNKHELEIAQSIANMGSWRLDVEKNELTWSKQSYIIFEIDYSEKSLTSDAFMNYIHPDDKQRVEESLAFSMKNNTHFQLIHRLLLKSGKEKIVEAKGKVSYSKDEKGISKTIFNGTIQDITLKFQKDKELQEKERLLRDQSKLASMGEMIGNIAHQWRQPLSVISTASTGMIVQKEYGMLDDTKFIETCEMINDNAQYLSKTIDDFRNFIQGDRTKKTFYLKDDINSFLHLVEGSIKTHNITIVPDIQQNIKINGYENELTQCLINIFNNAKDALKDNNTGKTIRLIFISTSQKKDKAIIKIKDNAGGIPEDILTKVFEPYFTTKHKSQGTGLGLHMTYNLIVDGMNGMIEVTNAEYIYNEKKYTGAEFVLTLSTE